MALNYGNKDLMRMEDIRYKSQGDWIKAMSLAKQMAELISLPGKAQARGYAAQALFGPYSPLAYIFFERAYLLGGEGVLAEASVNTVENIDEAYEGILEENLPGSRRENKISYNRKNIKPSYIESMGKVSLVKGTGPEFNMHIGVLEVWNAGTKLPRLIWTANIEPNFNIGSEHDFILDGKRSNWTMIDYIDTKDIGNLIPLYGKNLIIYNYA